MLKKLFEPTRIGKLNLRNRIVMPPMVTGFGNPDGSVSKVTRAYYGERAKGGVGLIIVEATAVMLSGRGSPFALSLYDDRFIAGFKDLIDEVHQYGAKIAVQLVHVGRQAPSKFTGTQTVAPSAIPYEGGEMPRELTRDEIREIVENFSESARRAKEAGFDAIEIHGAHGYLISEFLSPRVNKRGDQYGGGIAGRAALALEIVRKARTKVGKDFPILFRISADEYLPGGVTLGESCVVARMLQEAGVDCMDVSGGTHESMDMFIQPSSVPPGCLVHLAEAVKKAVNIPVITVGRMGDPLLAESILLQGKADLVAMGRSLIVDPELPQKAMAGRLDEIRPCLACRHCLDKIFEKVKVTCAINPRFGEELSYSIVPTPRRKKVLIIGGGPAGLEAARISALRGHEVALYEKSYSLGGQLKLASVPPYKQELASLIRSLASQLNSLGVEVHLGSNVTLDLVLAIKPDAVVMATGNAPIVPAIPGVQRSNVFLAVDVLAGRKETGKRVVIIGGGQVAALGKIIIAVDEDIDPRDADAVNWAMALRMQPHRDVQVVTGKMNQLDLSAARSGTPYEEAVYPSPGGTSALLIDATMKWTYPPVSLPKREFMENARQIWQDLGLPELKPKQPWHGYELGEWTEENHLDAERALRGEHYKTGEQRATRRTRTADSRRF